MAFSCSILWTAQVQVYTSSMLCLATSCSAMQSARTYCVCPVNQGPCSADNDLWVIPAYLHDYRGILGISKTALVELQVFLVVEKPVREEHLGINERGVVSPDQGPKGQVALVHHRRCDVREV